MMRRAPPTMDDGPGRRPGAWGTSQHTPRAAARSPSYGRARFRSVGARRRRTRWHRSHTGTGKKRGIQHERVRHAARSVSTLTCFLTPQSGRRRHRPRMRLVLAGRSRDIPWRLRSVTSRRSCCVVTAVARSVSTGSPVRSSSGRAPKVGEERHAAVMAGTGAAAAQQQRIREEIGVEGQVGHSYVRCVTPWPCKHPELS